MTTIIKPDEPEDDEVLAPGTPEDWDSRPCKICGVIMRYLGSGDSSFWCVNRECDGLIDECLHGRDEDLKTEQAEPVPPRTDPPVPPPSPPPAAPQIPAAPAGSHAHPAFDDDIPF